MKKIGILDSTSKIVEATPQKCYASKDNMVGCAKIVLALKSILYGMGTC